MEENAKKWYILIYTSIIESFFCIPETNTALLINYILIQISKIKNYFKNIKEIIIIKTQFCQWTWNYVIIVFLKKLCTQKNVGEIWI